MGEPKFTPKAPYNWSPVQTSFSVSTMVHTLMCDMGETFGKTGDSLNQPLRMESFHYRTELVLPLEINKQDLVV